MQGGVKVNWGARELATAVLSGYLSGGPFWPGELALRLQGGPMAGIRLGRVLREAGSALDPRVVGWVQLCPSKDSGWRYGGT